MNNTLTLYTTDTNGTNDSVALLNSTSSDSVWRHIALVCSFNTAASSNYTVYADATIIKTFTGPTIINTLRSTNNIGKSGYSGDPYTTCFIDDFRLYSVPLTNVQVSTVATKCYTFARYLRLTQPQQICLNIAEIQVYSVVGGTNIAFTSTATSSTVLSPYAAANIKYNSLTTFSFFVWFE